MAKDRNPLEDLSSRARQSVPKKEQVLEVVDNYLNFIQQAISSYPTADTVLGETLKSYANRNMPVLTNSSRKRAQRRISMRYS